eukprot:scaffold55438_cov84-Cyclotella_meneghiniana.AAC.1
MIILTAVTAEYHSITKQSFSPPEQSTASDAGPRSSGVRRSSERARGRKQKDAPGSDDDVGTFE